MSVQYIVFQAWLIRSVNRNALPCPSYNEINDVELIALQVHFVPAAEINIDNVLQELLMHNL